MVFRLILLLLLLSQCGIAKAHHTNAKQCLALAMYFEARGEGLRGMHAVGAVVMNRVRDKRFPSSTCAVVQQGGESPPCQFSWWCDGKSDKPRDQHQWRKSLSIADELLMGKSHDPTRGALYFHSTAVNPKWRLQRTTRVGNHIFYR